MELPTSRREAERAEYESVLASAAFGRSKVLRAILTAICTRYFNGETHTSEYHIAFEALGRKEDFNPVEDATIRVNVHNLRKRLKEFYESDGKDHSIQIQVPVGGYAPEFVQTSDLSYLETAAETPTLQPPSATTQDDKASLGSKKVAQIFAFAVLSLLAIIAVVGTLRSLSRSAGARVNREATVLPNSSSLSDAGAIRISAGSSAPYQDQLGRVWESDSWVTGGTSFNHWTHVIQR